MHFLHVVPDSLCGGTDKLVDKREAQKKKTTTITKNT